MDSNDTIFEQELMADKTIESRLLRDELMVILILLVLCYVREEYLRAWLV